jgi:phosphonate transport system substrate-binding protein
MSERDADGRTTRRRFLAATGVTGTALLGGYAESDDGGSRAVVGSAQDGDPTEVTWVMNPAEEEIDITVQYQPLFEYLESEADVTINELPTASYSGTVQELRRAQEGDRIFADTSPGAVAQIPEEIDVTGIRVAFGSDRYFSLITTMPDSGIEELADLEGETIATAAPTSVSGTLFPLLMLKSAGLDVGSAPGGSPEDFELRTSDHSTAREQLVSDDRIAAAGTGAFSTAPHVPKEQFEELSEEFAELSSEYESAGEREPQLDLLSVSDPIPRAPIVSNAAWDEPRKDELRQLMIDAPEEAFQHDSQAELAEQLGVDPSLLERDESELTDQEREDVQLVEDHELWFSGIEPATVEDYQPIAELGQELGLNWEDL